MSKTLNYTRPDEYAIARKSCPPLAQMMERFATFRAIDDQIGLSGSASAHWARGKNKVAAPHLRAMEMWLKLNPENEPEPKANGHIKAPEPIHPEPDGEAVFMVIVPRARAEKIKRVLAALSVEAEEI